jgi:MFS family permease
MLVLGLPELLVPLAAPGWRVAAFVVGMAFLGFSAVVYNVAQVSYRQAICPPRLLGRMNAAVRWVVWGTIPLGGLLGGALGTLLGVRPTLWIAFVGSWAAGWLVYFSPLRAMRDIPEEQPGTAAQPMPQDHPGPQDQSRLPDQPGLEDQPSPQGQPRLTGQQHLEDRRAPGSRVPGHGGRELPDGAGPQLSD